ncbi:MAG: hypothetical protein OEU32_19425, partial [Acidimicrobiia bacterium]|nr:hypothetical protein [Acidimicrobiia bacterium]
MSDALTIFRRLDADRGPATAFTAGEAAVGVLLAGLALVAWASLTLAQLGELRRSSLVVVVVVAALILAVLLRRVGLPTVTVDRTELWLIGAVGIVAAIFFIPGAPYAIADKDPGVYATHAFAIARTGSTEIPDAVLANADTVPAVTPFGG